MHARLSILYALVAAVAAGTALVHDDHAKPVPPALAPVVQPLAAGGTHDARAYFTDTRLLTEEGQAVRFYSDVLKDKVVVLNVVFTNCDEACPLLTHKLKEVRDGLGEALARRVHFISISSDPERDSPQALKAFARKNDVDIANWTFLTGKRADIDVVLGRLGQLSRTPEEHSTLLIAGDVANKRWNKIRPDAPSAAIVERLKLLVEPLTAASR